MDVAGRAATTVVLRTDADVAGRAGAVVLGARLETGMRLPEETNGFTALLETTLGVNPVTVVDLLDAGREEAKVLPRVEGARVPD